MKNRKPNIINQFRVGTLLLIMIIINNVPVNAQPKLSSYNLRGEVDVQYVVEEKDKYSILLSIDDNSHFVRLEYGDLPKAEDFFIKSYEKFLEWVEIAKENNVTDVRREIGKTKIGNLLGWNYGGWQFAFGSVEVVASMRIADDGTPYCVFVFPKKSSSSNRYIESNTKILMFGLDDDFDSFVIHLNQEHTKKLVDEYNSRTDLFGNK
jgi:sRNA-binding regulator protein Hfq